VFALSSLAQIRPLVTPGLVLLGLGLGVWNVGTLGLMMDMSPHGRAGTFLGFWTLVVTFARGLGVSGGGILRDMTLNLTGDPALAYGIAFSIGFVGLAVSLWALMQINMADAADDETVVDSSHIFAGAMD
jgi:BCD family chlorophyll transporter-like MFS transporter